MIRWRSSASGATWLPWATVAMLVVLPYLLLVLMLIVRPRGLLGTRDV